MKTTFVRLVVCTGILLAGSTLRAQFGAGADAPGMKPEVSAAMLRVFGKQDFSAKAEMKMGQGDQSMAMPMDIAVLGGKMRSEMDMTSMKGVPAEAAAMMKQMGMDKMVSISRPDMQKAFVIYPGMKAYAEMPQPKEEADASQKEAKVEKTELGKETVDGHPTVKNKIVITDDSGKKHEMIVWNATDLKDFPIKMTMKQAGADIEVVYKDVTFAKPEAAQFEPPKDFEKFASVQQMFMKKMMGAGVPKP